MEPCSPAGGGHDQILTAVDPSPVSEVMEIRYQIDGGAEVIVSGSEAFFPINADGEHVISFYAVDTSENEEAPRTETVKIDQTTLLPDVPTLPALAGQCEAEVTSIPSATDAISGGVVGTTSSLLRYDTLGSYAITWFYDDGHGNTSSQSQSVLVKDTLSPEITSLTSSATSFWPANHQMVAVSISIEAKDNCSPSLVNEIVRVTSSEPENGLDDGDTAPDWMITGPLSLNLRAERAGNGSGRIYTITVQSQDAAGNSAFRDVTVTVPKSRGK